MVLPVEGGRTASVRRRLVETGEEELDHVALAVAGVGQAAVPEVVVDDRHRAGAAGQGDLGVGVGRRVQVLRSRHDPRGAHLPGGVLGVVEGHAPAGAVVPPGPAVLVQLLGLAPGLPVVAEAVGVQVVVLPQQALQGAVDGGAVEDAADAGDPRQDVVAGVGLGLEELVHLLEQLPVEVGGEAGVEGDVAVAQEPPQGVVVEGRRVGAHGGLLSVPACGGSYLRRLATDSEPM